MVQILAILFGIILISIPATAQIYQDKANAMAAPLEDAVEQANAVYSNVPFPGDDENAEPQEARYEEMTNGVDEANEHHFDMGRNELK